MERKVVAYIEHRTRPGLLAAFVHVSDELPLLESGLQVPAGSIESDESDEEAALREAREESGIEDLEIKRRLGTDTVEWPGRRPQHRTFFHLIGSGPERWRHDALHEGVPSRTFEFVWIPLDKAPLLAAGQGLLAHLIAGSQECKPR